MRFMAIAGAVAALTATMALAQDFEALVDERQQGMKDMGSAMKAMGPIMKGETAYDAAAVHEAAQTIASHSGETLVNWFPEGSIDVADSDAKPEIRDRHEEFAALARQLHDYALALDAAADAGLGAPGEGGEADLGALLGTAPAEDAFDIETASADAIYGEVGKTCGTCHKTFRVDDD
ncbi:cytochrome c [uncultured Jannaschia sp.]|uniref:c-type cytochrome n=1 Tax=uncultured Jannaschia sp. TaxID=293347 RepID=UPI00261F68A0|nr:cytochrome c [uncultured Jannaschia sp.]